jgi:hypothetical protein
MEIPPSRGPVSSALLSLLAAAPGTDPDALSSLHSLVGGNVAAAEDILQDDDLQLSLFCLYELHYGGLDGVDDRWEWEPGLLAVRHLLENPFEQALRAIGSPAGLPAASELNSDGVASLLFELAARDTGPALWPRRPPSPSCRSS